jgi:RNA polymerase sigma factor (TIGR02999 family)
MFDIDEETQANIAALLRVWAGGDSTALDGLLTLLYPEMRRLAAWYMAAERPDHTLQPTALVHEAYMKLALQEHPAYKDRAHFVAAAALAMRRVLADHARFLQRGKRHHTQKVQLEGLGNTSAGHDMADVVMLDDALTRLEEFDSGKSRLLELSYFGGLTHDEIADAEQISVATVKRHLNLAEAWLQRELGG